MRTSNQILWRPAQVLYARFATDRDRVTIDRRVIQLIGQIVFGITALFVVPELATGLGVSPLPSVFSELSPAMLAGLALHNFAFVLAPFAGAALLLAALVTTMGWAIVPHQADLLESRTRRP